MRYVFVLLASLVMAVMVATVVSLAEPERAEAANNVRVKSCTKGTVALKPEEKTMLELHNRQRARRNLPRLCVHPALQRAARAHSANMIQRDYFKHGNVGKRLRKAGYRYRSYGENIAWGTGSKGSPKSRFKGWMNSSSHRPNILSRKFREVGIGLAVGKYSGYRGARMWTADFGRRR